MCTFHLLPLLMNGESFAARTERFSSLPDVGRRRAANMKTPIGFGGSRAIARGRHKFWLSRVLYISGLQITRRHHHQLLMAKQDFSSR